MKSLANLSCLASVALGAFVACETASGWTIYDNSAASSDLATGYSSTNEFGDQIILDTTTGARIITNFSFEYFGIGAATNAQVTVSFYANDLLVNGFWGPGTLLWTDTTDPLNTGNPALGAPPTERSTLWWQPNVFIPADTFTWTVKFTGLSIAGGTWGLDIYDPPTVGNNYDDYWEHDALGNWLLKTNRFNTPMSFGARVEAVPEPHAAALGLAGALVIFMFRASLRKA